MGLSDILQTQANAIAVAQTHILDMVAFGSFLSKIYRSRCTSLPTLRKQDFVIKLQGQESKNLSLVPLNSFQFIYLQLSLDSFWKRYFSCASVSSLSQVIHGKKARHDFEFVSLFKELISIILGRFMTKLIAVILETK